MYFYIHFISSVIKTFDTILSFMAYPCILKNGFDPFRYITYYMENLSSKGGAAALPYWCAYLTEGRRSRFNMKGVSQVEDDEYKIYD